jgi:hypothetical protein
VYNITGLLLTFKLGIVLTVVDNHRSNNEGGKRVQLDAVHHTSYDPYSVRPAMLLLRYSRARVLRETRTNRVAAACPIHEKEKCNVSKRMFGKRF